MSIIIRLQNLPWAATCMDIRRYFWGLSIPEGGVHIVGGEMGDAFIGFSTDEDARQAMSRDGGKIHEMQIRLLLSSHAEMMRVIEKARQQNMSLQAPPLQPPPVAPLQPPAPLMQQQHLQLPPVQPQGQHLQLPPQGQHMQLPPVQQQPEGDRGRRGRSPSPARRPRERSPPRSSSSRRSSSKRDRSRTPPRGSRSASSERRRAGRRDDRRYDDRYRDDRYRKDNNGDRRYHDPPATNSPSYSSYDSRSKPANAYPSDRPSDKSSSVPAGSYTSGGPSYDPNKPSSEDFSKRSRRSRFDPEPQTTSSDIPFFDAEQKNKLAEALRTARTLVAGKQPGPEYSSNSNSAWPQQTPAKQEGHPQNAWPNIEKRHPHQGVVPMDLESSPTSSPSDNSSKIIVGQPYNSSPRNSHSFMHGSNEMPSRHHPPDQKDNYGSNKPLQWSAPAPTSVTVEVRGVPPNVEVSEVLNLFHSASLTPANVFILTNPRGEADKALVQFHKLSDAEAGLARQPCYIRNFCCEVVSCPDALFKAAVANAMKPAFKPRSAEEEDRCVQLTGLSFSCKESDVVRFFGGLHIQDMAMNEEKNSAYVQFSTVQDFHSALSMSGKILGHEYVTISISNKEILNAARASYESRRGPNNFGPPHPNRRPHIEKHNGPPMHENGPAMPPHGRPQNFAVHLRDLPEHTTDKAINDFFNKTGICVKAIHILLTPENVPSGEGFIEVGSKEEADIALTRHKCVFLGQPILVTPIPYHEMNKILNRPPLLPTPEDEEHPPRRPEGPFNEPEFDRPPNGRPPRGDFGPPVRGERPFFNKERPRGDFRPERPFFPRQRGERPRMDGPPMRGPRPSMRGGPFNRMRGPYPPRPRGPWDPSRAREQGEIGAPGCVVNIDNLHFDAGFEEILEFFKGYGILRDNIIRKYDEHKNPTSKARVAFHNPWDAERAVRELNHQKIKGRSLKLSIL